MKSLAQQAASRANGFLSRGPKTKEGKRRSSMNPLSHGLLAKAAALKAESRKDFQELVRQYTQCIAPRDPVEQATVEEISAAAWRLHRLWATERDAIDLELAAQSSSGDLGRLLRCYGSLVRKHPHFRLLQRYETRLQNVILRSLACIQALRQIGEKKGFELTTPVEHASGEAPSGPAGGAHCAPEP